LYNGQNVLSEPNVILPENALAFTDVVIRNLYKRCSGSGGGGSSGESGDKTVTVSVFNVTPNSILKFSCGKGGKGGKGGSREGLYIYQDGIDGLNGETSYDVSEVFIRQNNSFVELKNIASQNIKSLKTAQTSSQAGYGGKKGSVGYTTYIGSPFVDSDFPYCILESYAGGKGGDGGRAFGTNQVGNSGVSGIHGTGQYAMIGQSDPGDNPVILPETSNGIPNTVVLRNDYENSGLGGIPISNTLFNWGDISKGGRGGKGGIYNVNNGHGFDGENGNDGGFALYFFRGKEELLNMFGSIIPTNQKNLIL
jgi:hypothetical protein